MRGIIKGRTVFVGKDGDVNKAIKKLKKKVNNSGILQDVKERQHFEKPSEKRKLAKARAKSRWKKKVQQQQLPPKSY